MLAPAIDDDDDAIRQKRLRPQLLMKQLLSIHRYSTFTSDYHLICI